MPYAHAWWWKRVGRLQLSRGSVGKVGLLIAPGGGLYVHKQPAANDAPHATFKYPAAGQVDHGTPGN